MTHIESSLELLDVALVVRSLLLLGPFGEDISERFRSVVFGALNINPYMSHVSYDVCVPSAQ